MTRTDQHRPSAIVPTDYDFVGFQYLRVDDLGSAMFLQSERLRIQEHMARTGGERSGHEHGGNCDVCGSAFAVYKALFWHRPSNTYVSTGLDCAEKLECSEVSAFRRNVSHALDQKAGKRKAAAVLERAGLGDMFAMWERFEVHSPVGPLGPLQPGYELLNRAGREERTVQDVVSKLVKYGSLSPAQIGFLHKLADAIKNRPAIEAKRDAERLAAKPLPLSDKRVTIEGKVVSIKVPNYDRGEFGPIRMLVQHADGWKVFGSVPSNLSGKLQRGHSVKFCAAVKASGKDDRFGFFSRPTKSEIVAEMA